MDGKNDLWDKSDLTAGTHNDLGEPTHSRISRYQGDICISAGLESSLELTFLQLERNSLTCLLWKKSQVSQRFLADADI
jgi:hypothetical protein